MKVLIIDPWSGNTSIYPNGLCFGLADKCNIHFAGSYYYKNTTDAEYNIIKCFFKYSDRMRDTRFRKVIRGLEYIKGYHYIVKLIKKNHYDVIHIQWFLQYKVDLYYLRKIKTYVKNIVYTAHNIYPHIDGQKYIQDLSQIYSQVNKIIVHGKYIKEEFKIYFPEFYDKVRIQHHGIYLNQGKDYTENEIDLRYRMILEKHNRIYLFFGGIFYNKGVDIAINLWEKKFKDSNSLLIVAGKQREHYPELKNAIENSAQSTNLLLIEGFVEENLLNYLINKANLILLPYRHASMSGVIFTAAEFKKTVLCTNVGSLTEYLENEKDSFITENNVNSFLEKWLYIDSIVTNNQLNEMGDNLFTNIHNKYSWKTIGETVYHIYLNKD